MSWLSLAYLVPRVSKNLSYVTPYTPSVAKVDSHSAAIQAAKRALDHVGSLDRPSPSQIRPLTRKLLALNINAETWDQADDELDLLTRQPIDESFSHAIKKWRDRTRFWTIQSRELYAFLKNTPRNAPLRTHDLKGFRLDFDWTLTAL